jgi:anaerobic ribonucleoside-triphosphate reductase activating protein
MNYNTIKQLDIANGPGCRVSLFVQGCEFNCPGCFNTVAKDFEGGKPFTDQTVQHILELCAAEYISGLSILGGEPLHPRNRTAVLKLARKFKEVYPGKSVWLWTGYLFEDIAKFITDDVDVIVDGKFVESLKDLRLPYAGSSNQRVIDVKTSIMTGVITLYK